MHLEWKQTAITWTRSSRCLLRMLQQAEISPQTELNAKSLVTSREDFLLPFSKRLRKVKATAEFVMCGAKNIGMLHFYICDQGKYVINWYIFHCPAPCVIYHMCETVPPT